MNLTHPTWRGRLVVVATWLTAIACAGCSSPGSVHADDRAGQHADASTVASQPATAHTHKPRSTRAEQDLRRGIESYEEAEYETAARNLQSALDRGLKTPADKAKAYKYLAFVACASGKVKSCRADFRNALQVDPKFDLAPAEAGHPIWGPVFRNAKLEVDAEGKTR
jgi:hypothetical protein